jgi:hypothetical protein
VLPSLMTLPGAMLVGISTLHKKSGLLFERYKKAFGAEDGMCRSLDVEDLCRSGSGGGLRDGGGARWNAIFDEGWRARTPEQ